ncbi:MAG TPA: phosphoglycerate mutase family protein [Gaiellaceae bacterium]
MPLILLRHAWAGDRDEWEGDDRARPLDGRGRGQALAIVANLADYRVDEIHTSPYVRCVQTVEPLAAARGLEPAVRDELGEERQATAGARLLRELAGRDVVVCGHGGLEAALPDPPKWRKGAALVLDGDLRVVLEIRA